VTEALAQLVVTMPPVALICGGRTDERTDWGIDLLQSEGRSVGMLEGRPREGVKAGAEPLPKIIVPLPQSTVVVAVVALVT
jgi:hypothetical protein